MNPIQAMAQAGAEARLRWHDEQIAHFRTEPWRLARLAYGPMPPQVPVARLRAELIRLRDIEQRRVRTGSWGSNGLLPQYQAAIAALADESIEKAYKEWSES